MKKGKNVFERRKTNVRSSALTNSSLAEIGIATKEDSNQFIVAIGDCKMKSAGTCKEEMEEHLEESRKSFISVGISCY